MQFYSEEQRNGYKQVAIQNDLESSLNIEISVEHT